MHFSLKAMSLFVAAASMFFCAEAQAEESLVELTHRGLDLSAITETGIVVESEEIAIGQQNTFLKYRLSNPSAQPLSATLAFPFPDLDFSDPDTSWSIPAPDSVNFIALSAQIDRKPAKLTLTQSASVDGKDIGAMLRQYGVPLIPVGSFQNQLQALAPDARARLAKAGLVAESGTDQAGAPLYFPRWTVRTTASFKTTLAPAQTITVGLKFRTSVGVSRDSVLREPLRSNKSLAREVEQRRADFCLDRAFYGGVDKLVSAVAAKLNRPPETIPDPSGSAPLSVPLDASAASARQKPPVIRTFPEANVANLREKRIVFDLAAGAPEAPLKTFRLRIDKGRPDQLVSLCLDNLQRISPTVFEMEAKDFRPNAVLRILLIGNQ